MTWQKLKGHIKLHLKTCQFLKSFGPLLLVTKNLLIPAAYFNNILLQNLALLINQTYLLTYDAQYRYVLSTFKVHIRTFNIIRFLTKTRRLVTYSVCYVVVLTAARWCYSAGAAFVDDVKIASPATKTNSENYISMTSRQGFDQVNELSLLIFTY